MKLNTNTTFLLAEQVQSSRELKETDRLLEIAEERLKQEQDAEYDNVSKVNIRFNF